MARLTKLVETAQKKREIWSEGLEVPISCGKYEADGSNSACCKHFDESGSCLLPNEFVCVERLRRLGQDVGPIERAKEEADPFELPEEPVNKRSKADIEAQKAQERAREESKRKRSLARRARDREQEAEITRQNEQRARRKAELEERAQRTATRKSEPTPREASEASEPAAGVSEETIARLEALGLAVEITGWGDKPVRITPKPTGPVDDGSGVVRLTWRDAGYLARVMGAFPGATVRRIIAKK